MTSPIALRPHRSGCPISTMLDMVGDRWSLVVVRDLAMGKSRFNEFLESPEGITTNILADRLKRMEADGLISRTLYQERPKRYAYALTDKGRDLMPVVQAMCRWTNTHYPDTWTPPEAFMKL